MFIHIIIAFHAVIKPNVHTIVDKGCERLGPTGDGLVLTRAASTRGVIPPLSAVSRRSFGHELRHPSHPHDFDEEDDDVKSDFYDDDEGEEEGSEGGEEEVVDEELEMEGQVSRPKSSATTRDSGISVFSAPNDGEAPTENGKVRAHTVTNGTWH